MPYQTLVSDGLVVESEHTRSSLKIYQDGNRLFTCEVTAASPTKARITSGIGRVDFYVGRSLMNWLSVNGYRSFTYERQGKSSKTFKVKVKE